MPRLRDRRHEVIEHMQTAMRQHRGVWLLAAALAVGIAIAGCTRNDPGSAPSGSLASSPPSPAAQTNAVHDIDAFIDSLSSQIPVSRRPGSLEDVIRLPGHHYDAAGDLYVHEFRSPAELRRYQRGVSADGTGLPIPGGMVIVEWASPRMYAGGRVLALYFGQSEATRSALRDLLGPSFAPRIR